MDRNSTEFNRKIRLEGLMLGAGIVLLLVGMGLRQFAPAIAANVRVAQGLGVLVIGISSALLARDLALRKNPEAARRAAIEERDERMEAIRFRAGNQAFFINIALSMLALMAYSFTSQGAPEPDLLWFFLAFMVVVPGAVYIYGLVRYNEKY